MHALTQNQIISSFRGATKSELKRVTFPTEYDAIDFAKLEYFGWHDLKIPRRAYVAVETDDGLVTLLLTRAEATPRRKTMCAWCRDVTLTDPAVLYSVRRGGPSGRNGDTIGILVCESFSCATNARRLPPARHKDTDIDAVRADNLAELSRRVRSFVTEVLRTEQ